MIRTLVVDDQELVRGGLVAMLEAQPGIQIVGEAGDGWQAVEEVRLRSPDVVLMDIRMPRMDGIEATRRIVGAGESPPKVLVLTTFDVDEYVYDAMRAGAAGFLLKDTSPARLAEGIRTVAAGEALLAPTVTRRLVEHFVRRPAPASGSHPQLADLTPRELDILQHVAGGHSNAEIARTLFLSEATVKTHVTRILAKLGLRGRVQAVVLAYELGLVEPGGATGRQGPAADRP